MKKIILYVCAAIAFLICAGVLYTTEQQPSSPNTTKQQKTTPATGERIKIGEGLYQVLDDSLLEDMDDRTYFSRPDTSSNYFIQALNENTNEDNCIKRGIEKKSEDGPGVLVCHTYGPQEYDVFLVLNKNKEVMYRFQLEEPYSFISRQGGVYEIQTQVFWKESNTADGSKLQFTVSRWDDFGDLTSIDSQIYFLYPQTGKITLLDQDGTEDILQYLKILD